MITINDELLKKLVKKQESKNATNEQLVYMFAVICELMSRAGLCEEATNINKNYGF